MSETISIGEHIIVQRQNYRKLHKFNKSDSCISLGRDNVNLNGIEGHNYFSVFKMIPKGIKRARTYQLELCNETIGLKDEIEVRTSGLDNRNIIDDGNSQKLSAADIAELKSDSSKASEIVETLISNSNTFHNKTEYSQDKYLKKKEKKYFEYLQILRPNLRMIAEIMFKLDPVKIQNLRLDTLSQVVTFGNVYCEGTHLLYDSGSNGLMAAALLSAIGEESKGKLIHMHPGNMSQKQALLAMNFKQEQYDRCISVNVYSALRQFYQGCDVNEINKPTETLKRKADDDDSGHQSKVAKIENEVSTESKNETSAKSENENSTSNNDQNSTEVKIDDSDTKTQDRQEPKKPKWHFDNIEAAKLLDKKVDSLIIACKEDPENIFKELVNFVKPGRPFVIYHSVAEPLQALYLNLKSISNVSALKLTCNWMRNYQILPDRTHPDVNMSGSSGFLLTGYVLK